MKTYTIERLKEEGLIIFEAIMGSRAYGTALPTSDTDIRGVFIQPLEDILGFGHVDQVSDSTNDTIYYEVGRFLNLLKTNNPNILELLYVPEDCVLYKDPIMDIILDNRIAFLTKTCRWSFGGYAIEQIKKARGLNKKINWEESEMVRKTVLDFCYVLHNGGSMSFEQWATLKEPEFGFKLEQEFFGLAKIEHAHDFYAMYYLGKGNGIISGGISNDVKLTSIPKGIKIEGYLSFNKDAYSTHCKKYKEYQTWLVERNQTRVNMVKEHGKKYDGKNLGHTFRLLETAIEIAEDNVINVRRNNREKLLQIRRGEYEYEDLLQEAEDLITKMDSAFKNSGLPESIETDFVNNILIKIRKIKYNLK